MANDPLFATLGTRTDSIEVRLSYKIVELFSEGLYSSPNKAVEELVANSFDAGAQQVHVILSTNLHDQDASIVVIDDGEGDGSGWDSNEHWLIGVSNKRRPARATSARAETDWEVWNRQTSNLRAGRSIDSHLVSAAQKYFSTSMDYRRIDRRVESEVEPKAPITIDLTRTELSLDEAQPKSVEPWTKTAALRTTEPRLFGEGTARNLGRSAFCLPSRKRYMKFGLVSLSGCCALHCLYALILASG